MNNKRRLFLIHWLLLCFLISPFFIEKAYSSNLPEQQVTGREENISELENLKKKVEKLEKEINFFELNKKLVHQMLDITERNLSAPWFAITIFGLSLCGLMWSLWREFRRKYNRLSLQIKEEREKHIKDISESLLRISESLAKTCDLNALQIFYNKRFKEAVEEGEKALRYAIEAFGDSPQKEEDKYSVGRLKSNLAYYYVEAKREDMKTTALKYAEIGLEIGKEFMNIDMIDNFLYVFMKFGITTEHKLKWKEVYENYRKQIEEYSKLSPEERQIYEDYYEEIKKVRDRGRVW